MGWGNCGTDSDGRPIGYNFKATCDHAGCKAKIHRGLAYVCGQMHGEDANSCEGYFCDEHVVNVELVGGACTRLCFSCEKYAADNGLLVEEDVYDGA